MISSFQNVESSLGKDRNHRAKKILNLTLEIIYLLTGEDYILVKTFGELVSPGNRPHVVEGWSRMHNPITEPSPPSPAPETNNNTKILQRTNEMIKLLTGEVPIRCQDVSVYFSMEEWEYLEGHKDLYKDIVMMEDQPPLTSLDGFSNRNPPERFPQKHQKIHEDGHSITQAYQDENLIIIKVEEDEVDEDPYEIPLQMKTEGDLNKDFTTENQVALTPDRLQVLHRPDLSCDPNPCNSALLGGTNLISQQRAYSAKKRYFCSECGKCFAQKSGLGRHERNHRGNYDYTCSHCGKSFTQKAYLVVHERIHTNEKPFSCSVCGKCFNQKPNLLIHERIHSDIKPYTCSSCGKCFKYKSSFTLHERLHTGDKPFPCSMCGKRFSKKSSLVSHERRHIGQKPLL